MQANALAFLDTHPVQISEKNQLFLEEENEATNPS
jgi:hypothetical protein